MRAILLFPLVLAALILAACTDRGSSPSVTADADSVSADPDAPLPPLRLSDLADACAGQAVPRAAVLPATAHEPPRLLVLVRDSAEAAYEDATSEAYFRTWGVYSSSEYPAAEVVACLTGFPGDFLRTCEFSSSRSDSTYALDLFGTAYNVRLREARTGTLLGEFGLDATSDTCPLLHTFADGASRARSLVRPPMDELKDAVLARLAPDYDTRREIMDGDEIRHLDSMDALVDSLRNL